MKISIITPSFNQFKFIERTVNSVSEQTYNNYEHIIFDGGSTDGTQSILKKYAKANNKARIVFEPDRGQAHAINKGFEKSNGQILTWLNSDDFYSDSNVLVAVVEYFSNHPNIDVLYARGWRVDSQGNKLSEAYLQPRGADLCLALQHSLGILQPAVFWRRKVYETVGGLSEEYDLQLDYEYWIRIAQKDFRFGFLDRVVCKATVHEDAKSTGQRQDQLNECLSLVNRKFSYVPIQWISRYAEFFVTGKDRKTTKDILLDRRQKYDHKNVEFYLLKYFNTHKTAFELIQKNNQVSPYKETWEALHKYSLHKKRYNQIVITSFDSNYLNQGLNLIASLHRTSWETVDKILVYSLDLSYSERKRLGDLEKVQVVDYPNETKYFFPEYLHPKTRAYKSAAIRSSEPHVNDGDLVLWMDAGLSALQDIQIIFDLIAKHQFFMPDHDDRPNWPFYNVNFTHPRCQEIMSASNSELLGLHLCSCLVGYRRGGKFQRIIDEAYKISQNPDAILWPKKLSNSEKYVPQLSDEEILLKRKLISGEISPESIYREKFITLFKFTGHRTQAIYSILAYRYDAPHFSAKLYHRSNDKSSKAAMVNWKSTAKITDKISSRTNLDGQDLNVVIYHHRGIYNNLDGMRYKRKGNHLFLLGNGPSLANFDFSLLRSYASIGMNAAYRFWNKVGFYPTYYCCFDTVVIESHRGEIFRLIREQKTNGIRKFFLRENILNFYPELSNNPNVFFLERIQKDVEWLSKDKITTGSFSLLIGWFLGYRWIYLLGIDLNYVETLPEAKQKGTILELESDPKSNPNYFFPDYQQKGDRYNPPNRSPGLHLRSWQQIKFMIEDFPITVVNLNKNSGLKEFAFEEFPKLEKSLSNKFADIYHAVNNYLQVKKETVYWRRVLREKLTILLGPYERSDSAHLDETKVIYHIFQNVLNGEKMIDVGAHHGSAFLPFLNKGWQIFAFEPDQNNRLKLVENIKNNANFYKVKLDSRAVSNTSQSGRSFYSSKESTGVSSLSAFLTSHQFQQTVDTITLREALTGTSFNSVDFLKIDTEGHDIFVLQGFPWDDLKPAVIECEFEDSKTLLHGYTFHDLAQYLVDKGYVVYVSEWHPIIRYGIRHNWCQFTRYPCELAKPNAWGNILAFRDPIEEAEVIKAVQTVLKVNRSDTNLSQTDLQFRGISQYGDVIHTKIGYRLSPNSRTNYIAFSYTTEIQPKQTVIGKLEFYLDTDCQIQVKLCRYGNTPFESTIKKLNLRKGKHFVDITHTFKQPHRGLQLRIAVEDHPIVISDIKSNIKLDSAQDIEPQVIENESCLQGYDNLVDKAWFMYCQNNFKGMAYYLLKSLETSPYLPIETVVDWIETFNYIASESNQNFSVDHLSNSLEWEEIIEVILSTTHQET